MIATKTKRVRVDRVEDGKIKRVEDMTSKQKHLYLKRLAGDIRRHLFEMLRCASEILEDRGYVDDFGGYDRLMDALEADEFAHFGGDPSLGAMINAYRKNPNRDTWAEYKYNIRAMIELASDREATEEKERINWKALAKKLELDVQKLTEALAESRKLNERLTEENKTMNQRIGELTGEVNILKGLVR